MIKNPNELVKDFFKYIESPSNFEYGMLCVLSDSATPKAKNHMNNIFH